MKGKNKHGGIAEQVLDAVDGEIERRYYGEVRPLIVVRPSDGKLVIQRDAFDASIMMDVIRRRKIREERRKSER